MFSCEYCGIVKKFFFTEHLRTTASLGINGFGIILYVRKDIPAELLITQKLEIEDFYVELNLRNQKRFMSCSYNPKKDFHRPNMDALSKNID